MRAIVLLFSLFIISSYSAFGAGHIVSFTGLTSSLCFNNCSGQVTAVVTGGIGPFSYAWSPNAGTNAAATGLCATTYTCTVTDNSDLSTATASVVITSPPLLSAVLTTNNTNCFSNCDGSISAIPSGGTPVYTYLWAPSGQTTATITGLCAGSYTFIVTDANGCTATANATVLNGPIFSVNTTTSPSTCGNPNGTATGNSTGGTPPFTYMWSPAGGTAPTATGLSPGTYTVTVTDANGCIGTATALVTNTSSAVFTTGSTNANCSQFNGSVYVNVSSGVPPYSYLWVPGMNMTDTVINLAAGIYTLTITDGNACTASTTVAVNNISGPAVTVTPGNLNCSGNQSGILTANPSGGTPPYTFSWNTVPVQTTVAATSLFAGNYYVTVTDAANCISFASGTVTQPGGLYVGAYTQPANCLPNGSSLLYCQGGVPPYSYQWNTSPPQTTALATGLGSGTYSFTVTDANGCTFSASVNIFSSCDSYIKGRLFDDQNGNCVQDNGEPGIQGKYVRSFPSMNLAVTNANGDYILRSNFLNTTVSLYNTQSYWTPLCPISLNQSVAFTTMGDTISGVNWALDYNSNYVDHHIHPGWTQANPGFTKNYWVFYHTNSSAPQNPIVQFDYDSNLIYLSSNQNAVVDTINKRLTWNLPTIQPSQNWVNNPRLEVSFYVPVALSLSTKLHSRFEMGPLAGDANPDDNVVVDSGLVTGSRDPNSKHVHPEGVGPDGNILATDLDLRYTIHFQNNGNDTCYTVVVIDTLPQYVDPTTLVPGASSHPYTFTMDGQGICKWRFDNILLPDSNTNEPASNGYFNFTIKQYSGNQLGTQIRNHAYIFFDFNSAIITDTALNTIYNPLTVEETSGTSNGNISVFPNPFKEKTVFLVRTNHSEYKFELFNSVGELVHEENKKGEYEFELSRNHLPTGLYFYSFRNKDGMIGSGKLIVQ